MPSTNGLYFLGYPMVKNGCFYSFTLTLSTKDPKICFLGERYYVTFAL